MTTDGPSARSGEAPMPESSPGLSPRRAGGGNGGGGGCPRPPPPPRPPPSAAFHEDHRREVEALRAELEAERLHSQEARRRFALEARELREAAEKQRQVLADQLRSKWEQQRARELHQLKEAGLREREAEIRQLLRWKEAELRQAQELLQRERDAAMRQARDLQRQLAEELVGRSKGQGFSGKSLAKLQEVLAKLRWEVNGDQAARIRHLKAELELERSLFLKYILQRFDGEQTTLVLLQRGPTDPPKVAKSGPHSPSSLLTACQASKSHSLDSGLNHCFESPQRQRRSPCAWSKSRYSRERKQQVPENALRKQKALEEKSHFPQEQRIFKNTLGKEVPMEEKLHTSLEQEVPEDTLGEEAPMESSSPFSPEEQKAPPMTFGGENGLKQEEGEEAPPEEKEARAVVSVETGGHMQPREWQMQDWLFGNSYDQLVKQNAEFLNALVDLEQRCMRLKKENILLREKSFPGMEDTVRRLKEKNAQLSGIAKRLEERAQRLQESSLKVSSSHIPVALSRSDMELYKMWLARQRAQDLSEEASVLLAKDQQLEALRRECGELHSKLSGGKESQSMVNTCGFERLLRESQKEVLRLQRQIMLKNLRESLEQSQMNSGSVSSSVSIQETSLDRHLENASLPKETLNILAENADSESLPGGNGIKSKGNSLVEIDSDPEYLIRVLKEKLSDKSKLCETLESEMEKNQKRCDELEKQLKEVLKENVRITEENSHLYRKNALAEKIENENTEIHVKLMQATDARNSAVQLTKGLESKVENLEQIISNLKEIVERRQQLVSEHEQTLFVLQSKEEEIRQLQQIQEKTQREHEKTVEQLEARVKELENQRHSQTEHSNLRARGLGQQQEKTSSILDLGSSQASYISATVTSPPKGNGVTCHSFHTGGNSKNGDKSPASRECTAEVLETHPSASESDSRHNGSQSCPNSKEDTTEEIQELETHQLPLNLDLENPGPSKLRVFLARYSYDPFDGPNKNPEAELPLTAGEYVYICGEMDEDGFYEGELMDGRRGMIPSNLVEDVSGNELISLFPLDEASDTSFRGDHELGCPYRNASGEGGNDNPDEDVCVNLLSSESRGEMCGDQTVVPYPRNLTLIRQLAKSVTIGWDPPQVPDHWGEVQSYNIYVNADLCCNLKHTSQMKAVIENRDLKSHPYRISVQSVTDKGPSDKLRCTFLVGSGFHIAPTLLELRRVTTTSAEISWLPSSSNYTHTVYLNEKEYDVTEAGVYWYAFRNLKPNSQYKVEVETRAPFEEPFPRGHLERRSRVMTFTTLLVGLPHPPLDVQVHPDSSAEFLVISWLPVTIDPSGSSNGVQVTGYAVYINGWKVTEVMSPTAGSVSLEASQLRMFHGPCKVFVKTLSPYGESVASVPAFIPATQLCAPRSLLPIPVVCNQAAESHDGSIAMANKAFPSLHSHLSTSNGESIFAIHFTSNRKESDTSTPVDISQNWESSPTWATLQKARSNHNVFSISQNQESSPTWATLQKARSINNMFSNSQNWESSPTWATLQKARSNHNVFSISQNQESSPTWATLQKARSINNMFSNSQNWESSPTWATLQKARSINNMFSNSQNRESSPTWATLQKARSNHNVFSNSQNRESSPTWATLQKARSINNMFSNSQNRESSPTWATLQKARSNHNVLSISQNRESSPTWATLQNARSNHNVFSNSQNREPSPTWAILQKASWLDIMFSNLFSSVWKQSSERVFPASRCGESANYTQAESQVFPEDTQKKRSKRYSLNQKTPRFKSQPNSKKVSVHAVTQPVNISKDSFSRHYVENPGACFWSPKSSVSSTEFTPQKGRSRRTGANDICLEEEPDCFLEKKDSQQVKPLCKAFSQRKGAEAEAEQISSPGSWRSPLGLRNYNSDSSDLEEEEEEDRRHFALNEDSERLFVALSDYDPLTVSPNPEAAGEELSFKEGQILKVIGDNSDSSDVEEEEEYRIHFACPKTAGLQGRPMPPGELPEKETLTCQTIPSLPHSSPRRNLLFGSAPNEDSERLFVTLSDYDPRTVSPNSEAAGEELSFKERQILKVIGDEDAKGYYRGKCEEKQGYIPCQMVSEIYIESKEVKEHLIKKSYTTEEHLGTG